jgi:hypothetical protein
MNSWQPEDGNLVHANREVKMKLPMSDTPPQIQEFIIEGYRRMTPDEKFKRIRELNQSVQQLALARIKKQYGNIPQKEQRLRLAALWMDRETMIHAFGWDPEKEGY